jgi:phosphatidylglycerol---prolipoprotein diacylglyceryl transferase
MASDSPPILNRLLDTTVHGVHQFSDGVGGYHPYFLCFDVALGSGLVLAYTFDVVFGTVKFWAFALIFLAVALAYSQVYLRCKQRLFGTTARSFLQDTLLFLLPLYVGLSWLAGHPLGAALDFLGLYLPLVLGIARVGCFLGGCCYGRPCRTGVCYPAHIFVARRGWRNFTPGPNPQARVFPLQLVEACVCAALLGGLGLRLWLTQEQSGATLLWFFLLYGAWRCFAEFLRGHRHRPLAGPLSEAQWLCLAAIGVSLAALCCL